MIDDLKRKYFAYVDTFRDGEGRLGEMMKLKLEHTMRVVENAEAIAAGENFAADEREAAVVAALLHDTGRYEQLKIYNTFNDATSIDHAVLSHKLVSEFKWLEGREDREAILDAILFHNRRELPENLDRVTAVAAKAVRDADKLDIFRVLEERVRTTDWRKDSRAFWNLPIHEPANPKVVKAVEEGRTVDYADIKSLADFVLIQVGWIKSGLYFATTRELAKNRGHLAFRIDFLKELC